LNPDDHPKRWLEILFAPGVLDHFKIEISAGFDAQLLRQLIFALRGSE
jgi:hypothetical protein